MKDFNIVIVGTGGQGQITLLQVLAEAALIENCDVKTSELHGLSQRGGSVEVHIRLGQQVFSPLVKQQGADLILAMEMQEALKGLYFSNKNTVFLINRFFVPILGIKLLKENEILNNLKKVTKNIIIVPAADICGKELGKNVVAGIYLLGYAAYNKIIPLKPSSIVKAVENIIPQKYLELNKKTLELSEKYEGPRKNK